MCLSLWQIYGQHTIYRRDEQGQIAQAQATDDAPAPAKEAVLA